MFSDRFRGETAPAYTGPKPTTWPFLAAAMIVVFILGASLRGAGHLGELRDEPEIVAVLIGALLATFLTCLLISGVVFAFVWFLFIKRTGREVANKYFAIILATSMLGALTPAAVRLALAPSSAAQAEMHEIQRVRIDTMERDARAFDAALQATGLVQDIKPGRLAAPGGLDRATRDIDAAGRALDKHRALMAERNAWFRRRIQQVDMAPRHRRAVLEGYDERIAHDAPDTARYWSLNETMLAEIRAMVVDLRTARGHWRASGDIFEFDRHADLDAFNRHQQALRAAKRDIEAVTARINGETAVETTTAP